MKLKVKHLTTSLLAVLVLLNFSCSKQESPSIDGGEVATQQEIERLEACSQVNFNKGVLLHQNVLMLFKCTKWSEEFPSMYQSIKRVQGSSWNHFMAPIDKEFVENLSRRDKVFRNIKELDSKNGLDDLSRVLVALNETNFFDSVKTMLKCVDNPSEDICQDRQANIPTKRSLKNIIRLVDTPPETIDRASMVVKSLTQAISATDEEKLRAEVNKFKTDPLFIALRLRLVDAIADKVKKGLGQEDREFLPKVLLTGNKNGQPWIYGWLNDVKMSREKFRDLVEYPILANPIFVGEIKGLKQAYDEGFNCTIKNTMDPNELVEFNFKTHLADYVTVLRTRDYKAYFDYSASAIVGLKMATEVCRELQTNKYDVNFIKMMTNLSTFLGEKKFYDLIKFLAVHTTAKGDLDKTFAENLYLFDIIASDLFSNANTLNEQIIKRTRDFYPVLFDVVQKLPPEAYINLGELSQEFLKEEYDPKFKGVADFWSFFNPTEKNFVFNFVDRHFEGDTQFVLLFDFYTKFMDDIRDVQPVFKDKWMGSEADEEMSYLSLQDMFNQFAGKETLADFKRFFGRDQILKVLEVISNGSNINASAKEELAYRKADEYVTRSRMERYKFKVVYDPGNDPDYDTKAVVECMQKFSELENGFYQLVRRLPVACTKVTSENIAFRMFGWMNSIEETYKEFNPGSGSEDTILSEKGLMSPYMLNTTLGTANILNTLLGDVDSQLPTKDGVRYLMTASRYHLEDKKAAALIEKNLDWLTRWLNVKPEENQIHRNAMLKTFTREQNFAYANTVSKNAAALMTNYSDWVKSGKLAKAQTALSGTYDPAFDCEKVINQFVAPNACPSKDFVKERTINIAKYLATVWEKEQGTAVNQLLLALKPGEGLNIPLYGKKTKKYRMTLKETMKYMYDTSDKDLPVNRIKTTYVNKNGKTSTEALTVLERVEVVIRDVRFGNNYLGVAFLNAVTQADDYNDEVDKRKGLLSKCLKIPGVRCGRSMSDSDLREGRNALETFDSLLDVNNGRGLEKRLTYGNFLKTFEQTLVASSAKKAQEVQLFPLKDEYLLQHNGRVLGEMTAMNMWSNVARVIRDRVGRTRADFDKFIESERVNRVNDALLYGFDLPQAAPSAERLLRKVLAVQAGESQNMIGQTVDWAASLNYNDSRLVEDTIARILLVGAYLGTPDVVFGVTPKDESQFARYKNNNLLQIFLALEKLVDYYPTLKNFMPTDMKLIDAFRPLNTALTFFIESLESTKIPEKNTAYLVLNDAFNILQTVLFDEQADPRLAGNTGKTVKGLDLLLGGLENPKFVAQTYFLIRDDYRYLDVLHENQASWFKAVGLNLNRVANAERVDLTPIRDYMNFTTKNVVCTGRATDCPANYHFDEMANVVKYLNKKSSSGETYFKVATRKLLVENFDQLTRMIDDLIPALKIKEVKPPFKLN